MSAVNIIVRTQEEEKDFARMIAAAAVESYVQQVSNPDAYLKPSQLVQFFPAYNARQISRWIKNKKVGKTDRNGRNLATRKQVEEFLFNR